MDNTWRDLLKTISEMLVIIANKTNQLNTVAKPEIKRDILKTAQELARISEEFLLYEEE